MNTEEKRMSMLAAGLAPKAPPKTSVLDKLKSMVSPNSTAGKLQGRKNKLDEDIIKAGG